MHDRSRNPLSRHCPVCPDGTTSTATTVTSTSCPIATPEQGWRQLSESIILLCFHIDQIPQWTAIWLRLLRRVRSFIIWYFFILAQIFFAALPKINASIRTGFFSESGPVLGKQSRATGRPRDPSTLLFRGCAIADGTAAFSLLFYPKTAKDYIRESLLKTFTI